MLDKTRDVESIDSVIEWLETKPPEEAYDYYDRQNCAAAQYNRAFGRRYPYETAMKPDPNANDFDITLERIGGGPAWATMAMRQYQTFGKALERAKNIKANLPIYA